jgi:MraZ protein
MASWASARHRSVSQSIPSKRADLHGKVGITIAWSQHLMYNVGGSGAKWGIMGRAATFAQFPISGSGDHPMLLGQYSFTLDIKGRLTMPSRFREELPDKLIITKGFDQCVAVYPIQVWRTLTQKISELPLTDYRGRELRRLLFSEAVDFELDKQGRMLIPDRLREFAGLELSSEVLIVGLETIIELWNPQTWEVKDSQRREAMAEDPALWSGLNV